MATMMLLQMNEPYHHHYYQQQQQQQQAAHTVDNNTSSHSQAIDEIARSSLDDEEAATHWEKSTSTSPQPTMKCFAAQKKVFNMANPADVQRFRAETTKLLILCLQSQCCFTNGCQNTCKIKKMASLLEEQLFQMAPTLGDYSNVRTLPIRLQIALPRVKASLRRKRKLYSSVKAKQEQQQKPMNNNISSSSRNVERFQQVDDLVQSIRYERHELVATSCAQCQWRKSGEQDQEKGSSSSSTTTSTSTTAGGIYFGSEFPPAVKQLYFGTPLVALWEKALKTAHFENDSNTSTTSSSIQWEPLVEQAQASLKAFCEWKAQHFLCQR